MEKSYDSLLNTLSAYMIYISPTVFNINIIISSDGYDLTKNTFIRFRLSYLFYSTNIRERKKRMRSYHCETFCFTHEKIS